MRSGIFQQVRGDGKILLVRDWSLITGSGGATKRKGGTGSFTPTKRGGGKSFSHAEGGGGTTIFGVVFTR